MSAPLLAASWDSRPKRQRRFFFFLCLFCFSFFSFSHIPLSFGQDCCCEYEIRIEMETRKGPRLLFLAPREKAFKVWSCKNICVHHVAGEPKAGAACVIGPLPHSLLRLPAVLHRKSIPLFPSRCVVFIPKNRLVIEWINLNTAADDGN